VITRSVASQSCESRCKAATAAFGLLLVAIVAAPAAAQILYGNIVGTVRDAQGAVMPGATVTIVNKETNLTREAITDVQGAYSFLNVLPGPYDVKVSMSGFSEAVRTSVPVTIGQVSRVDVVLQVGALSETVTVSSAAELLQTDTAEVKTDLKSTEITNLPLNRFRNFQSLVVLVPGSLPPTFQNAETDTPQRSLNLTVNGLSGNANTTLTDGATNMNLAMPHHAIYVPPAETIDTVSITTGSMDAETGRSAGAAITVVTKSGTNTFKGSAFEFFNNQKLNATPYYFGRGAAPATLPVERQTFGGTFGGPVRRNHVFFFGSYEGYISRLEQFTFFSVPDAALRNGDFRNALNTNGTLQLIYDPQSANLTSATAGRQQFPGNVIPSDRIHPISRRLLALYPLPNVEGTGAGGLINNYRTIRRDTTDRHNFDVKVNWNRTSAHQIWTKFSRMDAFVSDLFTFPIGSSEDAGGDTEVSQFIVGQTWTLGKGLLLDSSFGASFNDQVVTSPDFGMGMLGIELGIPGTNDQGRNDHRYAGMPSFSTGFTPLGNTPTWSPIFMEQRTYSFNTNLTKVAGQHDLKGGYFVNRLIFSNWQPERANPRGSFSFAENATRTFGAGSQTANLYNTYAAFLLGLVNTAGKSYQYELFTSNEWQHAMFFRDRWTVTPKLTVDLGLRWEYYPILKRADRQIEMLDLNTLDVLIGGVAGNPKNLGLVAPKDTFLPRAGVVYRLNDKTVVRTGYGLTVNPLNMGSQAALGGDFSYPQVLNSAFEPPASQTQFGWYGTIDQGIPLLVGPDLSGGRVALPNTVGMRTAVPDTVKRGKTHSWNVALERRLPLDVSVDVAYVGNRQLDDLTAININNAQSMGGGGLDRPYLISHGRQLAIDIFTPYRKATYHALQVGVTRPFINGLLLKGHYTYSRSRSLATNYQLPTPEAQDRNWALSASDRPHTITMSFVYQLPWHSSFDKFNIIRALINDWQVNGIFQAFSGAPFTVTADAIALNTPNNTQTADLVGTVVKVGKIGANGVYYDPSAWAQPEGVRFGNTRLNQFRGPGGWNLDFSLFRTLPVTGRQRFEFRIEASNVTDTPKFANPTSSITHGDFMRIFALNSAFAGREIRLAIRYSF
jgi:hypothetical protein